jgi:glycine C-acetyltransferase/8-amino-7-oxononanoate synthase
MVQSLGTSAKPILLTDGVFASSGEIAPLAAYLPLLPRESFILVDDAHAAGAVGQNGRGTPEYWNLPRERMIQTVTLSKTFGVYGGAVLGSKAFCEKIFQTHLFIGNTPLPLPLVCAALKSLEIVRTDASLRERLIRNVEYVKGRLLRAGYPIPQTPTPIIPIVPESAQRATEIQERLLANKVFPSFIRYPGGPENGYFRFALSSEHSQEQLDALLDALC